MGSVVGNAYDIIDINGLLATWLREDGRLVSSITGERQWASYGDELYLYFKTGRTPSAEAVDFGLHAVDAAREWERNVVNLKQRFFKLGAPTIVAIRLTTEKFCDEGRRRLSALRQEQ